MHVNTNLVSSLVLLPLPELSSISINGIILLENRNKPLLIYSNRAYFHIKVPSVKLLLACSSLQQPVHQMIRFLNLFPVIS